MIARGKLCEGSRMEQFGGVGFFALDPQQNFESHGSRREKRPSKLLSQTVAGFGPVAVDEFLGRHAALALELNLEEFKGGARVFVFIFLILIFVLAASDEKARSLNGDLAGRQPDPVLRGWARWTCSVLPLNVVNAPGHG